MASTTEPPAMATNSNDPMKLAIAMALIRSKLFSQHASSNSSSRLLHWKQKVFLISCCSSSSTGITNKRHYSLQVQAKIRKQEIVRLTEDLKHLEDDLRRDLYPETASCKCYFFNTLQINNFSSDPRLNDVLHRRFLRLVRLHKRIKRKESNSMDHRVFSEFNGEEGIEQLKISAEFLVDLCETPKPVKKPNFTNLAHQAVDFILGSLGRLLSVETGADKLEGTISNLIVRLVKRMCTPFEDELCDPENDSQIHIQHVCRTLGSASYIGQRVMLSVCHRISELAGQLLLLDPFDESFALIHDSMFMMIQLIEFLVSDNLVTWSKEEGFEIRLFEEWLDSFHNARKTLQSLEKRSVLYALYMDRVAGELARLVGQVPSFQKLDQEIFDQLFS